MGRTTFPPYPLLIFLECDWSEKKRIQENVDFFVK